MTKREAIQQRKKLLKLIEQWTRAEIMARYGRFDNLEFGDYARIQIEKADEIRRLVFGTDNMIALGVRWNMLKERDRRSKKKRKKNERRT
jgi:hypothetical protein